MHVLVRTSLRIMINDRFCCPYSALSDSLKISMATEAKSWLLQYGQGARAKYRAVMSDVMEFIDDESKRLARPIKDLDDVRFVMAALKDIREREVHMDLTLPDIEVCFADILIILIKYDGGCERDRENSERKYYLLM